MIKKYSYQDCWNYALLLNNFKNLSKIKNDIIFLCESNISNFWINFNEKNISRFNYKKICNFIHSYLLDNQPIPYLTKKCFFYDLYLKIKKGVFIPQKETELLIEEIKFLSKKIFSQKCLNVLDIGTGCGNIAISLAKINANWKINAIDINKKAVIFAKENALKNNVKNIFFKNVDFFSNFENKKKFDLIVSNPPYIGIQEYNKLPEIVKKQPLEALLAENNGMYFYQKMIEKAKKILSSNSIFAFEINPRLKDKIIKISSIFFPFSNLKIINDYKNKPRILIIYNNKKIKNK